MYIGITVKEKETVYSCIFDYRQLTQLPIMCPMMTPETTASDNVGYAIVRPIQRKSDSYMKILEEFKGFKITCFILVNMQGSYEFPADFFPRLTTPDIPCLLISYSSGMKIREKCLPDLQKAADSPRVLSNLCEHLGLLIYTCYLPIMSVLQVYFYHKI